MKKYLNETLGLSWLSIAVIVVTGLATTYLGQAQLLAIPAIATIFFVGTLGSVVRTNRQQWSKERQSIMSKLDDQLEHFRMFLQGTSNEHSIFQAVQGLRVDPKKNADNNSLTDLYQCFRVRGLAIYRMHRNVLNEIHLAEAEHRLSDDQLTLLFEQTNEMVAEYEETVKDFRAVYARQYVMLLPENQERYDQFQQEYNQWLKHYRDELYPSASKLIPKLGQKPGLNMVTALSGNSGI